MPHRSPWLFFGLCLLIAIAHLAWAVGELPERVATHFDASGMAGREFPPPPPLIFP